MSDDRLTSRDWVNAGLKVLAKTGFTALKADTLSKGLGASRGSFYWHFADVGAFHAAVLHHWREVAYENVIREIHGTAEHRLEALLDRAFRADTRLERAVRSWATAAPRARAMVEAVDARRLVYIEKLLIEAGVTPGIAPTRARLLYWAYLGFILSAARLGQADRRRLLDELARAAMSTSNHRTPA
ncbi:MAG: transcriptional regulator [Alphaproteobacteria bacterium RIFCSPHIGHO2_12_FULL_66_14]|jgi:AcrR family transcriptional regulator|nr:MAG: transcriptional regulator [Alphaproteobacteria bacterium RIFCSPHIGHO2_12_FULL_66_14]